MNSTNYEVVHREGICIPHSEPFWDLIKKINFQIKEVWDAWNLIGITKTISHLYSRQTEIVHHYQCFQNSSRTAVSY